MEWLYSKDCFDIAKSFSLRLYKMVANQNAPGLNRGPSSNFWEAEKCKPCEIYWRMCDVYKGTRFSQKNLYKYAQRSVNKVMLTVFWNQKGSTSFYFLEKGATLNRVSYCQLLWQNSSYLMTNVYTVKYTHTRYG